MVVPSVTGRMQRLMAQPMVAEAFLYASTRPADLLDGDVWDGKLLRRTSSQDKENIWHLAVTSDATEFGTTKSANYMPMTAIVLNFPPAMRNTFAALLLMALLPAKVRMICNILAMFRVLFHTFCTDTRIAQQHMAPSHVD